MEAVNINLGAVMQYEPGHSKTTRSFVISLCGAAIVMLQNPASVLALPPGGRSLYVANTGEDEEPQGSGATVARFTFDAAGVLTPREVIPACDGAHRIVFTPDLRFAYLACIYASQIAAYRVAADGALSLIELVEFPGAFGIAIAPNGHTLYVSSSIDATLAAYRVGSEGRLTALNSVDSGGDPRASGVAVTPDERFVYVGHGAPMASTESVLTGFALAPDGSLEGQVAEVPNGISGLETLITPDNRFLYVTGGRSNVTFGYQIGSDGSLTAVPGEAFPSGNFSVGAAIGPNGDQIYVAGLLEARLPPGEVTGLAIGADGVLTEIERVEIDGDALGITFTPDGRHLYVSDFLTDEVVAFDVSKRSELNEIQILDSGGPDPHLLTVLPNQGPVASFSVQSGAARSPSRFNATRSSDPDGRVARYDWDFGDGTSLRDGGPKPRHVYAAPGTYAARLTVTDDEGCSVRLVFTGHVASCVGSAAATVVRKVRVP